MHETKLSLEEAWETFRGEQEETWTRRFQEQIYREYINMACQPDGLEALRDEQERIPGRTSERDLIEKARARFEQAFKSDGVRFIDRASRESESDLLFEPDPLGSEGHESALKAEEFIMKAVDRKIRIDAIDEVKSLRHTYGARALLNDYAPTLLGNFQDSDDQ